jgi:adenosylcobinamide-phosphate synthase
MSLSLQLLLAFGLDLLIGDPRWFPHPVRFIGRMALRLEYPLRRLLPSAWWAGVIAVLLVLGIVGGVAWGSLTLAALWHPWAADVVGVLFLWTGLACRDLASHARAVQRALFAGNLPRARERVGWLVGRDTADLDEAEIARAAVESVGENLVDGVTAPLFWAAVGGPIGILLYKAVNTLDSTFGYRNARYLRFGWASARLDDVANWLPARLTLPFMVAAAWLLRLHAGAAWRIGWRDHSQHPSPNSGWSEAAMAGALGVRLGGENSYGGVLSRRPYLGDPTEPLHARHIAQANRLLIVTAMLFVLAFAGVRLLLEKIPAIL